MIKAQAGRFPQCLLISVLIILSCGYYAEGQSTTSSIDGVTVDSNGAVVPSAKITLVCRCNECPNRPCSECCPSAYSAEVTSDQEGHFRINNVPVGVYSLIAEADGFKKTEAHRVEVTVGASRSITLTLEPAQTVTVDDAASSPDKAADAEEKIKVQVKVINRDTEKPLENAKVTLFWQCDCIKECPTKPCSECCPSQKAIFAATTDVSGVVHFNGPPGIYLIDMTYRAFSKASLVRLKPGDTEKVKIALTIGSTK